MSKFEINGLDELQKELKNMKQAARDLEGTSSVSFEELFNQSFMKKYTTCNSFEDFLELGNFVVESQDDFKAIPDEEFDTHVSDNTKFKNWEDMMGTAAEEYAAKKLGF